jgi:UDP-N-acetylglucosamine:LPS N-acetylglucosamine transferase
VLLRAEQSKPDRRRVDLWLVASSGGHLLQLSALADAWRDRDCIWISNDRIDARTLLSGQEAYLLPGPYSRSGRAFFRNLAFALRLVRRRRPAMLLTTGADIAVPFALVARAAGAKVVYVESFTRIRSPSLSGRLIAPFADRVYAQWPELAPVFRKAQFVGAVVEAQSTD